MFGDRRVARRAGGYTYALLGNPPFARMADRRRARDDQHKSGNTFPDRLSFGWGQEAAIVAQRPIAMVRSSEID